LPLLKFQPSYKKPNKQTDYLTKQARKQVREQVSKRSSD